MVADGGDVFLEGGVVAGFDFEARGEAEAGPDLVKIVVAGMEDDLAKFGGGPEVELDPFGGIGLGFDVGMPALGGGGRGFIEFGDMAVEGGEGVADLGLGLGLEGFDLEGEGGALGLEGGALGGGGGVVVEGAVGAVEGGEDGLEAVVVFGGDGVEFVVVALGAMDRHGAEGVEGIGAHVIAVEVAGDLAVDFFFADFGVADEVPGAGGDEAEGGEAVFGAWEEDVAGELFLDEAGVGAVFVEGADDVVAVGPGVRAGLIFVVAVGFAEVDDVEPMAGPAFAVAGAGEELVDEGLVGGAGGWFLGGGLDEGGDVFWGGGEAGEVEVEAAAEGAGVGLGGEGEVVRG